MNTVRTKAAIYMAALFSMGLSHPLWADDGSVEERVARLERALNSRNLVQVEMQQQLDSLSNEVRQLRGDLEEANYKLQQAVERQKSLYEELDKAKSTADAPSTDSGGTAVSGPSSEPAASAQKAAPPSADEAKAYESAVNLVLKDQDFKKGNLALNQFLTQYPNSSYQSNAHYWLGQVLMKQGDNGQARTHFLQVAKDKDSSKRADAILKLGMISKAEGDSAKAGKFFQLVIKQYPDSTAAQMAQKEVSGK
ncbi:tol-pal system protein YbgF [Pseudaeromonas sp. ZJS20]|uniref:tol-pal system protein YbgF n=1 Tax=Pseudaeromonas aegiceratis TaxID=3153928 RepID=UPI00390CCA03